MTAFLKMILLSLFLLPFGAAADFGKSMQISRDGAFSLDGRYRFSMLRYDSAWHPIGQSRVKPDAGYPKNTKKEFALKGEFDLFRITETIQAQEEGRFRWEVRLDARKEPVPCKQVFLGVELPLNKKIELKIDGKAISMPSTFRKRNVFGGKARTVEVTDPYGGFSVSGNFHLFCVGKFVRGETEYYQLRFLPEQRHPEMVRSWSLALNFQYDFARFDVKSVPLDLSGVFNRRICSVLVF